VEIKSRLEKLLEQILRRSPTLFRFRRKSPQQLLGDLGHGGALIAFVPALSASASATVPVALAA